MALYSKPVLDFTRDLVLERTTRPLGTIALYYQNSESTTLSVQVTSTTIVITYQAQSATITYSNKTVEDVCLEINQTTYPIRALPLISNLVLLPDSLLTISASIIPDNFNVYDRLPENGVILRSKYLSIRHKSNTQIKILSPYGGNPTQPWYPRLNVGSFTQKVNGKIYYFSIPEFDQQTWSSFYGKPFKDIRGEVPTILSNNSLRVARSPLFWNQENIIIFRGRVPISTNNIIDVDVANGIIYLTDNIIIDDDLIVSYTYKEESYEYKYVNLNCHFNQNPLLLGKYVVIYLLPYDGLGIEPRKRTIYHSIGSSVPEAINSIEISNNIPIAILGAYGVQQVFSANKLKILDTRVKGGGLVEVTGPKSPIHLHDDIIDPPEGVTPIEEKYNEAGNFWDIGRWDGEIYPGAAAVVINLPTELRDHLPDQDIRTRATKFLAGGVYPILEYSDRQLPDITKNAKQVSCFFSGIYSSTGEFWSPTSFKLPGSLTDTEWDFELIKTVPALELDNGIVLEPTLATGVFQNYLKSTPIAGIEWEERELIVNTNSINDTRTYSEWKRNRLYDKREVLNHGLRKGSVIFDKDTAGKQYRNIKVHAPFRNEWIDDFDLDSYFSSIYNRIQSDKLGSGTCISYHLDIDENKYLVADYIGLSPVYNYLFNLIQSSRSGNYTTAYSGILDCYKESLQTTSEFILHYSSTIGTYQFFDATNTGVLLREPLEHLSRIIYSNRRLGFSMGVDGYDTLESLVTALYNGSTSFDYWPYSWTYDLDNSLYTGEPLILGEDLGYGYSEVFNHLNPDHLLNYTTVGISSVAIALDSVTGSQALALSGIFAKNKQSFEESQKRFNDAINNPQTYSGIEVVDTWFSQRDRLGEYAGSTIYDMIKSYEYLRTSLATDILYTGLSQIAGIDSNSIHQLFSYIENDLDICYNKFSEVMYRGGVLDRGVANLLYGYGWYVANFDNHYSAYPLIPLTDLRTKFSGLYIDGIDILLKCAITSEGLAVDTTYINGDVGPFDKVVPTDIFNTLRIGLGFNDSILPKIVALYNTISGQYFNSGLCRHDPYFLSNTASREILMSEELSKVYLELYPADSVSPYWEPINSDLSNIRGLTYIPVSSADSDGNNSSIALWKTFISGDITSQLSYLRNIGCNTIKIPLDYYMWLNSGAAFSGHVSHVVNTAARYRLRVIPQFWSNFGVDYPDYSSYFASGTTGVWYNTPGTTNLHTGWYSSSGSSYIAGMCSLLSNSTSVIGYEIIDNWSSTDTDQMDFILQTANTIRSLDPNRFISVGIESISPDHSYLFDDDNISLVGATAAGIFSDNLEFTINNLQTLTSKPYYISKTTDNIYQNFIDDVSNFIDNDVGGFLGYAFEGALLTKAPGYSGKSLLYSDGEVKLPKSVEALRSFHDIKYDFDLSDYTIKTGLSNFNTAPNHFDENITKDYIVTSLSNWRNRSNIYPLSGANYKEFYKQYNMLNIVQYSLDQFNNNYKTNLSGSITPTYLTSTEKTVLDFYRVLSSQGISNDQLLWTSGSDPDWRRYGNFFTNWGSQLWEIVFNHNLQK